MNNQRYILIILLLALAQHTYPQQSVILTGSDFIDVTLHKYDGNPSLATTNFSNYPRITAIAWTASSQNSYFRNLIKFNLSSIPSNSIIVDAELTFHSDPQITSSSAYNGNSSLSGGNDLYLERVTEYWDAHNVTWNTQPATTIQDRIVVPPSTGTTETLKVDLTGLIQYWIDNPKSNLGLMFKLKDELKYRSRNYLSTDHSETTLHPNLKITYWSNEICATGSFKTDPVMNDLINSNYNLFKSSRTSDPQDDLLIIPVVVHRVLKNKTLTEQDIIDALARLNRDYQNYNDQSDIPAEFAQHIGNVKLDFRLADVDEDGNPTTGIVDAENPKEIYYVLDFNVYYESACWNQTKYLNIWVVDRLSVSQSENETVGGFAFRPDQAHTSEMEGVVMNYSFFKPVITADNGDSYTRGRILAHEIGHYLGLQHIWGSGGCNEDDGITDTPIQKRDSEDCPEYPQVSCGSNDMTMNYMDYTDDVCRNMFTKDQVTLMRSMFMPGGYREDLVINSEAITGPPIPPYDGAPVVGLRDNEANIYSYPATLSKGENFTLRAEYLDREGHITGPLEWQWQVSLLYKDNINNTQYHEIINTSTNTVYFDQDLYITELKTTFPSSLPNYNWVITENAEIKGVLELVVLDETNPISSQSDYENFGGEYPLAISISGPTYGYNTGYYTWSGVANRGEPYTYYWEQSVGNNYSYIFRSDYPSTTMQLPYNEDLYLKLTMTDRYMESKTAYLHVYNKSGEECIKDCINEVFVYPNPSTEEIAIEYETSEETDVVIDLYDMMGMKKLTKKTKSKIGINKINLIVKELQKGFYFLSITNGNNNRKIKLEIE